jgi:hypothetical protein
MNLEIDFTSEFTNTRYAPLAVLWALYQEKNILAPLQQVRIPMRNRYFEGADKLIQILVSILVVFSLSSFTKAESTPRR